MKPRLKGYPYHALISTYRSWGHDPGLEACLSGRRTGGFGSFVRLVLKKKKLEVYGQISDYDKGLRIGGEALSDAGVAGLTLGRAAVLLDLSETHLGKSEYEMARQGIEEALDLYSAHVNLMGQAKALNILGLVFDNLGDLEKAKGYYEQALRLFEELEDKSQSAGCLNNLATLYTFKGDNEKALTNLERALSLFSDTGDFRARGYCLIGIGTIHYRMENWPVAQKHYEHALSLLEVTGERYGRAVALKWIASIEAGLGNYQKALSFYQQSYNLFRAIGDLSGRAFILLNLGLAHRSLGDFEKAIDFYQRALSIFRETGEQRNQVLCLLSLMQTRLGKGGLSEAEEAFREIQAIASNVPMDNELRCRLSQSAAALALEVEDLDKASQEIESGLILAESLGSKSFRALLLFLRARLKDKQGDWPGSEKDFAESANLFSSLGEKAELAKVSYYFGKALLAHGEKEKGDWYLVEARRLWDGIGAKGWIARMDSEGL